jgi:hypothetical protein
MLMPIRIRFSILMPIQFRIRFLPQFWKIKNCFKLICLQLHCFIFLRRLKFIVFNISDSILKFFGNKSSLALYLIEMRTVLCGTPKDAVPAGSGSPTLVYRNFIIFHVLDRILFVLSCPALFSSEVAMMKRILRRHHLPQQITGIFLERRVNYN